MKHRISVWLCCILMILGKWNSLEVSAEEISETDALSVASKYQIGWYKSWGGSYEELKGKMCTIDFLDVTEDRYYLYWNDSRIKVEISEYDESGKWLAFSNEYESGDEFCKNDKTRKVMVTLSSQQWGLSIQELLENGFSLQFTTSPKEKQTREIIFADQEDYSSIENWLVGYYLPEDGSLVIDKSALCFAKYRYVLPGKYMVYLPNSYLKMNIAEFDSLMQPVCSGDYYNGQKWEKQPVTEFVAISVFTTGRNEKYTAQEYKELIQQSGTIGLLPWEPVDIDTTCQYLTAQAYADSMTVGWNLGNAFDSKGTENARGTNKALEQELNWGNPYVTQELIDYVADCGIHTIRIPVTWYYNTLSEIDGNLHINEAWLERVKEVVDYALGSGMYVILNAHHEQPIFYAGVSEEEMESVYKNVVALWQEIAIYFKAYDEHLIFEGFNEIDNLEQSWNYSDEAARQMNKMNQIFVDTVRKTGGNNVTRLLCVPTLLDGYDSTFLSAFELPKDVVEERLLVQIHTYSTLFSQSIEPLFESLEEFANQIGAPVIIGEWGTTDDYLIPELREVHASNFVARAAGHGIKCIWWDNGSNYGIINRKELYSSDKGMMDALMAGVAGVSYTSPNAYQPGDESFLYMMPNIKTGELESRYWGTCVTDDNERGLVIAEGSVYCSVNIVRKNEAADVWLQRVLFYDEDGSYIEGKELQKKDIIIAIPKNAKYMRISVNSPYRSISWEEYVRYFQAKDLELEICFVGEEELLD